MNKSPVVQELELSPAQPETRETPQEQPSDATGLALVVERLAIRSDVDVMKLEKIIELQERILRHQAKAAFDTAFAEMQGEIPEIGEKGEIIVEGKVRSTYATNEDIQRLIKPILQRHGFSIRFRNEWLDGNKLKVVGILSHRSGHSEQDEFVAQADTSGSKNAIQALGSTRSYGQRYTTIALLNIATRGTDDDGQSSEKFRQPEEPKGFSDWLTDMAACADEGMPKLTAAWNKSPKEYRDYVSRYDRGRWEALKARAGKVGQA